jgi:hypothetical protein
MRDIDVLIDEGPGFTPGRDWDEFAFEEGLRFIAHDPSFYDPHIQQISASLTNTLGELSVPINVPIQFGPGTSTTIVNEIYLGTFLSYPIITLTGPLTAVTITNVTTDEELIFTHVLNAGDQVIIDLRFGYKTVVNPALAPGAPGYNLIGSITGDLGTFHLDPAPQALGGLNQIQVIIAGVGYGGTVLFEYYNRYVGI